MPASQIKQSSQNNYTVKDEPFFVKIVFLPIYAPLNILSAKILNTMITSAKQYRFKRTIVKEMSRFLGV